IVDLRSDTLTLPTPTMREAMARAEVGDDVWEEDPTVRRLEEQAARRTGKEAALFVSSGTQGNLVSVLAQTRHGQEIILDRDSHILNYEGASAAVFGGVQTMPVATERGFLTAAQVRENVRPSNIHIPTTGLVCLENTHNRHGGTCCTPEEINAVASAAHAHAPAARPRPPPPTGSPAPWPGRPSSPPGYPSAPPGPTSPATWTPSPSASPRDWPRPLGLSCVAPASSWPALDACARWWAAACARWAFSPRRGSSPSTPWSSGWPRITSTSSAWPRGWPPCPARASHRRRCRPTSSSFTWTATADQPSWRRAVSPARSRSTRSDPAPSGA